MNKNQYKIKFLFFMFTFIMLSIGCRKNPGRRSESVLPESNASSPAVADTTLPDTTDYSQYINKIWIIDDSKPNFEISVVITQIEQGHIKGYFMWNEMIVNYYFDPDTDLYRLHEFSGTVSQQKAECQYYIQQESRYERMDIIFCGDDRIRIEIVDEMHQSLAYQFRAWNVSDMRYLKEPKTVEIELDSWGKVTLFCADREPAPDSNSGSAASCVLLLDERGDILYRFQAYVQPNQDRTQVLVEDIDGDGLKDVLIVTASSEEPDIYRSEWYYFQLENGMFKQSVLIHKDAQNGYRMWNEGKDIWISFGSGSFRRR